MVANTVVGPQQRMEGAGPDRGPQERRREAGDRGTAEARDDFHYWEDRAAVALGQYEERERENSRMDACSGEGTGQRESQPAWRENKCEINNAMV